MTTRDRRLSAAVLGAGLIGVDLAEKLVRSATLDCVLVAARSDRTPGLRQLAEMGVPTATGGIRSILETPGRLDVVFDATTAAAHAEHARLLRYSGTVLIDLTPSNVGHPTAPTVNGADVAGHDDISMISCGGQAAIPVLSAISQEHRADYIEVVTTAASPSVGHATRLNLDEYVATTEDAVSRFTGVERVKAMLNISPARPPATFRVAMTLLGTRLGADAVRTLADQAARRMREFVPGYRIAACIVDDDRAFIAVEVTATGGRLPKYAGNLDIINSAAVHVAEEFVAAAEPVEAVTA